MIVSFDYLMESKIDGVFKVGIVNKQKRLWNFCFSMAEDIRVNFDQVLQIGYIICEQSNNST